MRKKTLGVVLFSALLAMSLVACGGDKNVSDTTEAQTTVEKSEETTDTAKDEASSEDAEASETEEAAEGETEADKEATVEYGNTIKVHFIEQAKGAVSEAQGKSSDEFVDLKEGDDEFVVSKDTTNVFSPYDYEVEESQIEENVNKAVGLKVGDTFTIGCEGGDGYYQTVYEIVEIKK